MYSFHFEDAVLIFFCSAFKIAWRWTVWITTLASVITEIPSPDSPSLSYPPSTTDSSSETRTVQMVFKDNVFSGGNLLQPWPKNNIILSTLSGGNCHLTSDWYSTRTQANPEVMVFVNSQVHQNFFLLLEYVLHLTSSLLPFMRPPSGTQLVL